MQRGCTLSWPSVQHPPLCGNWAVAMNRIWVPGTLGQRRLEGTKHDMQNTAEAGLSQLSVIRSWAGQLLPTYKVTNQTTFPFMLKLQFSKVVYTKYMENGFSGESNLLVIWWHSGCGFESRKDNIREDLGIEILFVHGWDNPSPDTSETANTLLKIFHVENMSQNLFVKTGGLPCCVWRRTLGSRGTRPSSGFYG